MKGSRARPPSSPESEESWTVDCPCGVNYDDGEEMVDCDECGVWVHTGCCRILKGHTSYVCDKCKFKKKKESEESEVAQLLVELPSKAPPLEEKVFTLPTELSREERAHVQGIPGGDSSFFVGVSPVFSRHLWKYTGYVPKVFQFNYNDLPQEKTSTCILFAEYAESRTENPTLDSAQGDHQIDEGKLVNTDLLPMSEVHTEKHYFSKDKHSKRDSKRESKYRAREQQEDFVKSPYHSKRRRDETVKKDLTSKRRSKNFGVEDYQGTPKRAYDEATIPLKSARIASRNSKSYAVYNSVEDADVYVGSGYNYLTKADELGSSSLGFSPKETTVVTESSFRKQLATKTARKVAPVSCGRHEYEGLNGNHRSLDTVTNQETHVPRKDPDGATRNKISASKNDGDVLKFRDQVALGGHIEGKIGSAGYSHIPLTDLKETSPRARLNVIESTKDELDGTFPEQYPSPVTEKLGKHHSNEDINAAAQQQYLSQKRAEHDSSANTSDDDERPLSIRVTNDSRMTDSLHVSADRADNQHLMDDLARATHHELAVSYPSPAPTTSPQEMDIASSITNTVSKGVIESVQVVVNDITKSSPKSIQTGPFLSAGLSSPTLSGSGVDSKQPVSMKIDSVSPSSERTQNVGVPKTSPSFKTQMESPPVANNKACSSVVSKSGNNLVSSHGNSNSTSKLRSKTHDLKTAEVMPGDLNEASLNVSLYKDIKELSKAAATGKTSSAKAILHNKAQPAHVSAAKQSGQLSMDSGAQVNALDQSVLQNRHSLKSTMSSLPQKSEKTPLVGPKSTAVLLSPSHAITTDVHVQGIESTRPVMNDEELALLLHQELNSSPRVARVARVRQGGTGTHPFSTKRSPMANTPVLPTATQKDPHLIFRRKNKDDLHGEVHGTDDIAKAEVSGGSVKQDHVASRKDKDMADGGKFSPAIAARELNRHLSPGLGVAAEHQPQSDSLVATDLDDGERRTSADGILTLPGLIEDILNDKGANASYDLICEEVLPHWSKLRKHNGERYAYTSHRQAVLDCLRNRSAWSHLIDRGPKTNLGRKRRRPESAVASESDHGEQSSHLHDGGEDHISMKASKEFEVEVSEGWALSDSNKDADLSLPEEVPKGKRKARRGRRLTPQSRGYGRKDHHGRGGERGTEGFEDEFDHMVSPLSEEPGSSSEEEEIFVHRAGVRHMNRHRGSSVDSDDDDVDL